MREIACASKKKKNKNMGQLLTHRQRARSLDFFIAVAVRRNLNEELKM